MIKTKKHKEMKHILVDDATHQAVKVAANRKGVSMKDYIRLLVQD